MALLVSANVTNRTSRSLVYGLNMLKLFTVEQPVRGIAELADAMSVSRPTAHRYASTCLELGYLEQAPMRRYRLTPRSAGPGMAMIDSLRVTRHSRPVLRRLREQTGRTVGLAVLDGADVLYLQRLCGYARGQHQLERALGAGTRKPAQATAAGLVLLAAEEVEQQGSRWHDRPALTIHRGGLHENALGLAVPVMTEGEMASAIELTVPADSMSTSELTEELGQLLQEAACVLQSGSPDRGLAPELAG